MENELPKLRIDSTGKGFYQADDANDEDAVCEYSKAIAIISQLRDEIALLKKGCPFEAENERLRKQVEELSKPVTDEEWFNNSGYEVKFPSLGSSEICTPRWAVDKLIAARAGKEPVDGQ